MIALRDHTVPLGTAAAIARLQEFIDCYADELLHLRRRVRQTGFKRRNPARDAVRVALVLAEARKSISILRAS